MLSSVYHLQSMHLKAIEVIHDRTKTDTHTHTRTKHVRQAFLHSLGMLVGLSIHFILTSEINQTKDLRIH